MKGYIVRFFVLIVFNISVFNCSFDPYIRRTENQTPVRQCYFPIYYAISFNTPEEYREPIKNGLRYWNLKLQHYIFYDDGVISWGPQNPRTDTILAIGMGSDEYFKKDKICALALYTYDKKSGCFLTSKILFKDRCMKSPDIINTLTRHEAGHLLGLGHFPEGNVMYKSVITTKDHPVDASNAEVQAVWKLYKHVWEE